MEGGRGRKRDGRGRSRGAPEGELEGRLSLDARLLTIASARICRNSGATERWHEQQPPRRHVILLAMPQESSELLSMSAGLIVTRESASSRQIVPACEKYFVKSWRGKTPRKQMPVPIQSHTKRCAMHQIRCHKDETGILPRQRRRATTTSKPSTPTRFARRWKKPP